MHLLIMYRRLRQARTVRLALTGLCRALPARLATGHSLRVKSSARCAALVDTVTSLVCLHRLVCVILATTARLAPILLHLRSRGLHSFLTSCLTVACAHQVGHLLQVPLPPVTACDLSYRACRWLLSSGLVCADTMPTRHLSEHIWPSNGR
jgi:hypothetical protein